jgi:D-lactate dehydrogenase
LKELLTILPKERIRDRYIDRVSFASDAGFYYLLPKAVVQPVGEEEIVALFRYSQQHRIPLVFRAGGTSLSGQSITDGILVDLSQFWRKIRIEGHGAFVRVEPGITGGLVNANLRKHGVKIGPDPSSIGSAMMGGILSNNSSGMCCGVKLNSYHTTKYIRFILPNGLMFDTENSSDYERFQSDCPTLFTGLKNIREEIWNDNELFNKIRKKYLTKTTIGYSLNAFIDFDHPLDILSRLLIGAEGTLAFIAEAVLHTVPDYQYKSTALLYFPNIYAACQAIVPLTNAGAVMVELMDRASLHAVENLAGMPAVVKTLPEGAAALLVEFQEERDEDLKTRVSSFLTLATSLEMLNAPEFTTDPIEQEFLWKVRKGLFPAVGAVRASGTTVILEDIAFPVEMLGDAILDLQMLFRKYDYGNAIIFGHAKDGNIHFVITQSFHTDAEITRYDRFIREVVATVVGKYDGTLKAEHGTGRNMAPFVETEWGGKAYEIIRKIKLMVDPDMLLNPGVIINDDREAHLKNLKPLPPVEGEVDRCIECGYCEHKCPSRDITTTPRRRIVIRRVLKNLQEQGDHEHHKLLLEQYQYDGIETCAVDGLCAVACPVDINTGDLIKRLRNENHSRFQNWLALRTVRNFGTFQWVARFLLRAGGYVNNVFGKNAMFNVTGAMRRVAPFVPRWSNLLLPPPSLKTIRKASPRGMDNAQRIVYYPACISRMMGSYEGKTKSVMDTFLSICSKNNMEVVIPTGIDRTCCSQMFSSKGHFAAAKEMAARTVDVLWQASEEGKILIVTDVSSCTQTLQKLRGSLDGELAKKFNSLKIIDSVDFLHDIILPLTRTVENTRSIVLHPVCSLQRMKIEGKFLRVAKHFAANVTVPVDAGCCGMAGDRGFLFPELTASATKYEGSEVNVKRFDGYYSSTKTCEMAMAEATQQNYESILYLVDENL